MAKYVFTCKSQEERGATKPNIITIELANDADAILFGTNLQSLFSLDVVTIDEIITSDYTLPYPAGTEYQLRLAMWDAASRTAQARVKNISVGADIMGFEVALIAAGILLPTAGEEPVTRVNSYLIRPGQSF